MTSLAQQFKDALLKAQDNYMSRFTDKKVMPLFRSQEITQLVDLLKYVEDPVDLHKKAFLVFMTLKLSLIERAFNFRRSVLRKELELVFEHFDRDDLRDEQLKELKKQVKLSETDEKEREEYKKAVVQLEEKLAEAKARVAALEKENAGLKDTIKVLEEKAALSDKSLSADERSQAEKLFVAQQTIQRLERSVTSLDQERTDLRSQNAVLRQKNRKLCEKALQELKDSYDGSPEISVSAPADQSSLGHAISAFGFKLG